ncbi:glutamate synthase-related protein [Luteococcus japonicus]|uniref:glutamate synthase-related protein n=1 Tax=Luteococcus japonicus TaxID=33984 RepID=UPI001C4DDD2D
MVFSDSVAYPFRVAFTEVYKIFAAKDLNDRVVWIGSGKLGLPDNAIVAFALDADMAHVARETMLAIGAQQQGRTAGPLCPDPATGPVQGLRGRQRRPSRAARPGRRRHHARHPGA